MFVFRKIKYTELFYSKNKRLPSRSPAVNLAAVQMVG